ncbi:alpha/beta hydrolase [Photorhabdus aegyptia]|uniref:Esterase/lipase n=1 Tax=Photorhabdus aegyptia TaxID=2805098 RepID=A0A022PKA3_9GAMM|nr:alpha/beta hydrolase [Photorhabdus aegyptia]EYU16542.1 esterase/lipase [Photorhabdus aegyptia]
MNKSTPWLLDAQLARVADMIPIIDLADYQKARVMIEKFKQFIGKVEKDDRVVISEYFIERSKEDSVLRVRVYSPTGKPNEKKPCLVYMHGGGFVLGDLEVEHARCQRMSIECECVIVSVDFRLPPEYPFPHGLNDCYLALTWVANSAHKINVDSTRIAVGGCSTGATLAASLALMARDHDGPNLIFQFLLYPALDDRLNTESMSEFENIPGGDRIAAEKMWKYYLTDVEGEPSYLAVPNRADDLTRLPHTYLMTNNIEVYRDEVFSYASRLLKAGVPTEFHCYSGTFHAFEYMVRTADISIKALEQQMYVLRRALHSQPMVNMKEK